MSLPPTADDRPPPLPLLLREAGSLFQLYRQNWRAPKRASAEGGHPVLVLPGFLADDFTTRLLRHRLSQAGYQAHHWGLGRNLGARADTLDRLGDRLDQIADARAVSLVGWSLGGLFARELAKRRPRAVAQVVTLGTPFSGDMRANNAWRLYERVTGHKVDAPPLDVRPPEKPPVPTTALWSRRDGIVAAASARGRAGEVDQAVEVACTHMGFMTDTHVADVVAGLLEARDT